MFVRVEPISLAVRPRTEPNEYTAINNKCKRWQAILPPYGGNCLAMHRRTYRRPFAQKGLRNYKSFTQKYQISKRMDYGIMLKKSARKCKVVPEPLRVVF